MNPAPGGAEPAADAAIEPLPCGRDAALVWDRATAGTPPDEHERDCRHCSAALADARSLRTVVHRMAEEDLQPPASLLERVMSAVRAELRPAELLPLPSPHGPARLSRPAAAAVLRHAVDRMAGLRARSCRIEQVDGLAGEQHAVHVSITVTARYGLDLAEVTARVRRLVIAAAEQALGLTVTGVDIDVVDLFQDGPR